MKGPLISVVMSVFNEPEGYLKDSIESILNQVVSDFEFIIVIDNPEYKEGREIIKSYAMRDNRIKVILNEKNEGLAASLNKGLSVARARYIARMDADDISFSQRLKDQYLFMEGHPEFMLIGSSITYIDEDRNILGTRFSRGDYKFLKRFILYGGTPCFHPTWFFKKELLEGVKGYRILPTSQDYDLLMRAVSLGIKISNIEEPLLYHRLHFNRVSAEKNIYQLKLTRYIMKAAKKNFIRDDERFTPDIIKGVLRTPRLFYLLHRLSLYLYMFCRRLKRRHRKFAAYSLYIVSVFISPYRLYHALWSIVRLILLKTEIRGTLDDN